MMRRLMTACDIMHWRATLLSLTRPQQGLSETLPQPMALPWPTALLLHTCPAL